jgi:hypothetical protein
MFVERRTRMRSMSSTSLLTLPAGRLSAPSLNLVRRPGFGAAQTDDRSRAAVLRAVDPVPAADTADTADTSADAANRPRVRRLVVFTGQLS